MGMVSILLPPVPEASKGVIVPLAGSTKACSLPLLINVDSRHISRRVDGGGGGSLMRSRARACNID